MVGASPKLQFQGLISPSLPGIPLLVQILNPANYCLVVGICSADLDARASRPEICAGLASKTWALGRQALWELARRVGKPGLVAAPGEECMSLEREVCLEAMNRHWSF